MKTTKSKGNTEQQGHECIRCTDPSLAFTEISDSTQRKLYVIIWKRTLSALMKAQEYDKFTINMNIYNEFDNDGKKISPEKIDMNVLNLLKSLVGSDKMENINFNSIIAMENNKSPPSYFSEATLIKKFNKDLKIGRPATVKGILEKNIDRKYIETFSDPGKEVNMTKYILTPKNLDTTNVSKTIGAVKNKLKTTALGINVVTYLCKDFQDIMDYD